MSFGLLMIAAVLLHGEVEKSEWCRCSVLCPCFTCTCASTGPCHQTCACARGRSKDPPTGVVPNKVGQRGERYTVNGKPVSKHDAIESLTVGQVPDDAKKLRLTIIGDKASRDAVLSDIGTAPVFASLRNELVIQDYEPDAPLIRGLGFKTDGSPTIYLQEPNGKVLLRQDRYENAERLAAAIRRADPRYDPSKDPDGKKVLPPSMRIPIAAWIAGAAGIVLLLWRGKP